MDSSLTLPGLQLLRNESLGDPEVCVAILDGPVDLSHPCFDGAELERLETLVQEPAGNGRMSIHGTHVASLIFGQPGSPVEGIAPRCRGLIVPVFRDNQTNRLSQLDLARAIEQAVQEGAHVINISGGERAPTTEPADILRQALQRCSESNVLVVAAAGNDACECLHVPAAVPSVLAVGAMDRDGAPLEISNWGEAYRLNGVLALGDKVIGAAPGEAIASLSGSSFAVPIVSGVAALLLSIQHRDKGVIDPNAIGRAILETASQCIPGDSTDCSRYLAGTLNIPGAYTLVKKGREETMGNPDEAQVTPHVEGVEPSGEETSAAAISEANGVLTSPGGSSAGEKEQAHGNFNSVTSIQPTSHGVAPAGNIPPPGSLMSDCGCNGANTSYIYAIGAVGFDYGTQARLDSFRQLMPRPLVSPPLSPPVGLPPLSPPRAYNEWGDPYYGFAAPYSMPSNPYNITALVDYLDTHPSESTKLIWTLNLELTPIYAIEAETAYAEEVYSVLRAALRLEAQPSDDPYYVSRVSIPGVLTNRTVRLFSGQVVPVVVAQPRGLYTWNEKAIVDLLMAQLQQTSSQVTDAQFFIKNYLDRIYYQLRNLGQMPQDRALNFSATNAIVFGAGLVNALTAGIKVPGGSRMYTLDKITVSKSPYCRMDSDCWDVQISFFDPENDRRARAVLQNTIDVSDIMPVSLAPQRLFYVAG